MAFLIKFSAASWNPCIDKNVLCIKISRDERFAGLAIILFQTREQQSRERIFVRNRCRNLLSQLIEWIWLFPDGTILFARYMDIELTAQLIAGTNQSKSNASAINWTVIRFARAGTHQISIVSHCMYYFNLLLNLKYFFKSFSLSQKSLEICSISCFAVSPLWR